jgi:hypothetical protein
MESDIEYEEFHIPDRVFWGFEGNNKQTTEMLQYYMRISPETYGKYLEDLEHVTNLFGLSYIGHYRDYSEHGEFGYGRCILKFRIIDKYKFMLAKITFPDLNFLLDLKKVQLEEDVDKKK